MQVPFLDLRAQQARIQKELDSALNEVIDTTSFVGGPILASFQEQLAEFMGVKHAVGVASGTAAISIAVRALGLEPDAEVITTAYTAVPTPEAITRAGARPVFADIDEATYQIDPDSVAERIGPRTRALVVVHLHGLGAPIDRLQELARRHDLVLIEDVAQAQGARFQGRRLGTFGRAGCLSFFPSKNLGGFGDGGAVVTDDEQIDRFVMMYSNHGRITKFEHEIEGANERLDTLQAAVLRAKLPYLDEWNARRRQVAAWYAEDLGDVAGVTLPKPLPGVEPVWHLYVVRVPDRNGLQKFLKSRGVGSGLHYPLPLHLQKAYAWMGAGPGSYPAAERVTQDILSLPMDPFLTREQVSYVAEAVKDFLVGRTQA